MMFRVPVLCALLSAFSLGAAPVAQVPVAQVPVVPPAMTTGGGYLFVLQDGVVHQYDMATLELLRTVTLPARAPQIAAVPAEPAEPGPPASTTSRESVVRALAWLGQHQDQDGRWDADGFTKHDPAAAPGRGAGSPLHDVGVTGLATLAFLGDGSTVSVGPHQDRVRRALEWLVQQQSEETGLVGTGAAQDFIYSHAIATVALCEGYSLSQADWLRVPAQRALDYLESHRNPYMVWRYQPRDNDNDTSVTGWAVMAYRAGLDAKLEVNRRALECARAWYEAITDPTTGIAGYTRRGEPSARHPGDHALRFPVEKTHALTASALFARFLLGETPDRQPTMRLSADRLLERLPAVLADHSSTDFYYWFFGSFAMYQMGGTDWQRWAQALPVALGRTQRAADDPNLAGSWDPETTWGGVGGRVYATALATLTLQSYYRYSRLVGTR